MKKPPASIHRRLLGESTRDAVLRILKLRGEATAIELSKNIKVTYTAIRRHLSSLQGEGLVSSRSQQHGTGRPVFVYRLTEEASASFPSGYENMSAYLLDTVFAQSGHTGVMDILRLNNDRVVNDLMPKFANKSLAERVRELALYFTENGYMSGWTSLPGGDFFLYNQNCAIFKLAVRYRQLCILEPRLIERLLGVKVTRQQYILKHQPICGYLVDSSRPS